MLQRTLQSLATLVAIIVAYQCYVLVAVPWLEPPPLVVRDSRPASDDVRSQAVEAVTKYQRLLAAYFPAGHWSQQRPPKVIESGQVMLVIDNYTLHDDGRVDIDHCAVLVFPTPRTESPEPPRDAVIVEAPSNVTLQFDEAFRPERMQIGQITGGVFPGRVTIRSDMNEPGPDDDLLVETRDLKMNSKLLYTEHEVRFRLGPNVGSGRELEIRLLESDPSPSGASGLRIAGVDQLEIRQEVRLSAFLGTSSLLPGDVLQPGSHAERGNEDQAADQPPVEVRSSGPFRFDFVKYVASFDENVEVWQANPAGQSDQLNCEQLDVHFARKLEAGPPKRPWADPPERQRKDMRALEASKIVAQGYPVVIVSPSRNAEARGGRIELMLRERKVKLDGGQDVRLTMGPNIVRAPMIQYQHPAKDAATKIGNFRADGPGSLHYLPDAEQPEQVFEATWQASVRLGRNNGQPVLTLAGRPRLALAALGQLTADQIRVSFREVETDGKSRPIPDQMNAVGQVEIDSPELLARTRELRATFIDESHGADAKPQAADDGTRFAFASTGGAAKRVYQVKADEIELDVGLRGPSAVPKRLACNNNVTFRELADPYATEQPFEVGGGRLTAEQLDENAQITIHGAAPNEPPGSQLAQIQARGMTVRAADVKIDQGRNRLWIDGPGTATMVVRRDLVGRDSGTPYPLEIRWQGGLEFDGRNVVFQREVFVDGADDQLRCDQLIGTLTAPVEFGKRVDQDAIDLAEVECRGNVAIDHRSRDAVGITSHDRMQLARLAINQLSGVISGDGPGVIRSTHFANQLATLGGPPASRVVPDPGRGGGPPGSQRSTSLQFLRVDFQAGLAGNLYTREISFFQRVRTVYGPVDAWEQELDMNRHEPLPPDTITLTSNELRINEDPVAASQAAARGDGGKTIGPVQLHAVGNVRIDGDSPTRGKFAATADRAAYEQVKELFILEGTDRSPATLWHRELSGGQQIEHAARKIHFDRRTNQIQVDGARLFEFTPGGPANSFPQNAVGPAPRRQ